MKQCPLHLNFSQFICSSQRVSICYNTSFCILKPPILGDLSQCNSAVNNLNDEVDSVRTITVKQMELCAV